MKRQLRVQTVHTIDLGPEQLQIIEDAGQQIRVLFRGVWLRKDAAPRRPGSSTTPIDESSHRLW